jgi:hypothetical protein
MGDRGWLKASRYLASRSITCCRWVDASDVRILGVPCGSLALVFAFGLSAFIFVRMLTSNHLLPSREGKNRWHATPSIHGRSSAAWCRIGGLPLLLGLTHSWSLVQCSCIAWTWRILKPQCRHLRISSLGGARQGMGSFVGSGYCNWGSSARVRSTFGNTSMDSTSLRRVPGSIPWCFLARWVVTSLAKHAYWHIWQTIIRYWERSINGYTGLEGPSSVKGSSAMVWRITAVDSQE